MTDNSVENEKLLEEEQDLDEPDLKTQKTLSILSDLLTESGCHMVVDNTCVKRKKVLKKDKEDEDEEEEAEDPHTGKPNCGCYACYEDEEFRIAFDVEKTKDDAHDVSDEEECKVCGGTFTKCSHHKEKICQYCPKRDPTKTMFRGHCIFCLFDGTLKYEDEWADLGEILDRIAIRAIKLGNFHRKLGKSQELYPCKSKNRHIKSLYKLFSIGWNSNVDLV
jgi:hypothetical protein